jgi:hypothetical protein
MIAARVPGDLEAVLAQVAARAAAAATARAQEAALNRAGDAAGRWRDAGWLWPEFAGGRKG